MQHWHLWLAGSMKPLDWPSPLLIVGYWSSLVCSLQHYFLPAIQCRMYRMSLDLAAARDKGEFYFL